MGWTIKTFADPQRLAATAAADWLDLLQQQKSPGNDPIEAALSGGRITKLFFAELVQRVQPPSSVYHDIFKNRKIHFFWADERCVPPNDPECNYKMARELLFEPLKVPDEQIHRIRGEAPEKDAIQEVTDAIWGNVPSQKRNGQPFLDMIFLGMGEDGHVASLFPGESEDTMDDPAVYHAVTAVKPPPRRITLGYGAIANAADVWVLASGSGKEAALEKSLSDGKTPLARVLRLRANRSKDATRIYTDIPLPDELKQTGKKI